MKTKRTFFTFSGLLFVVVSLSLILPVVLLEQPSSDSGFPISAPATKTPFQPREVFQQYPTNLTAVPISKNCTYHLYYWVNRMEEWPAELIIGTTSYTGPHIIELYSMDNPDARNRLILQMYTALLNAHNGANLTVIDSILEEANDWLISYPPGSSISEFNRGRASELATLVAGFNIGLYGPGACSDVPPTPGKNDSPISRATLAPTNAPISLPSPRSERGQNWPKEPPPAPLPPTLAPLPIQPRPPSGPLPTSDFIPPKEPTQAPLEPPSPTIIPIYP